MFKGCGQVIWPRPSTKLISHLQGGTIMSPVKFGADRTIYTKVIAISFFMAFELRRQKADSVFDG